MNDISWNALILTHIKKKQFLPALHLYQKIQHYVLTPDSFSFVALLKACGQLHDLDTGCKIHMQISKLGLLEDDMYVGNSLVDMYAKCRSFERAKKVFDMLPVRDLVSWNTLIAGYARYEYGKEALRCFEDMQQAKICPNAVTYVCCLKACGSIGAISKGKEIHAGISETRLLDKNFIIANALVEMYAKCGCIRKAEEIFSMIPFPDIFSWNALITGYAKCDQSGEALRCFEQMQLNRVMPNVATFIYVLRACGKLRDIGSCKYIHAEIARRGLLERESGIGNALVDMYTKCGLLCCATEAFNKLISKDVITWTTLIWGYANYEYAEDALNCYMEMQVQGLSPNAVTLVCVLRACSTMGADDKGMEMHAEAARRGFLKSDISVCNALIDMYGKCGIVSKIQEVFHTLLVRDVISWTAFVMGYIESGNCEEALLCLERMEAESVSPNIVTYVCCIKACGNIRALNKGRKLHVEVSGLLEENLVIGNALIDMYVQCKCLAEAQGVLDKLHVRDVVSWTALITGYVKHECSADALNSFGQMQLERISPNVVTLVSIMKACWMMGAAEKGQEIHMDIARRGVLDGDLVVGNALIDMYSKCGSLDSAQQVFDALPVRDVITWNALIAGYTLSGETENVFYTFEKMRTAGEQPDPVTFLSVLHACTHTGIWDKGKLCFEVMCMDYGIRPTLAHQTCIMNLLTHTGQLNRAIDIVIKMESLPDNVLLQCILDSSRKLGNLDLAKLIYEYMMELDDKDPSPYISICNIFADSTLALKV